MSESVRVRMRERERERERERDSCGISERPLDLNGLEVFFA